MPTPSVYLFYRTPYEGLLSRRLIKLEAGSILEWFQMGWDYVNSDPDIELGEWVTDKCGGDVYGLWTIFEAAVTEALERPATWQQLHKLLLEHLYVEGRSSERILMDQHSLRVYTDDDETDLSYYFFESACFETFPEAVEYLVTDFQALEERASTIEDGTFESAIPLKTLLPNGDQPGSLYGCFLTAYDSESLELEGPFHIPGIRLNSVLDYLRTVNPCTGSERPRDKDRLAMWPRELRWMRGFVEDADTDLAELFRRSAPWMQDDTPDIDGPRDKGRAKLQKHIESQAKKRRTGAGDPSRSQLITEEHFLLYCSHRDDGWGGHGSITYFQFFLFDDLWASGNPVLANSILRYSKHWDPFRIYT